MKSFLDKLQQNICKHLQNNMEEFPVSCFCPINSLYSIDVIESNIAIAIMPPLPQKIISHVSGFAFEQITVRVRLIFNPPWYEDTPSPIGIISNISTHLHHWKPPLAGIQSPLMLVENNPWSEIKDTNKLGRYILEAEFTTSAFTTH